LFPPPPLLLLLLLQALMPLLVYSVGTALGTEKRCSGTGVNLAVVVTGVAIASYGEPFLAQAVLYSFTCFQAAFQYRWIPYRPAVLAAQLLIGIAIDGYGEVLAEQAGMVFGAAAVCPAEPGWCIS
jgi:hypothetical protein